MAVMHADEDRPLRADDDGAVPLDFPDETENGEFIIVADILMPDALPVQPPSEVADGFVEPTLGAVARGVRAFGWAAHGLLPSGWGAAAVLSQEAHTFKAPSGRQHQARADAGGRAGGGEGED